MILLRLLLPKSFFREVMFQYNTSLEKRFIAKGMTITDNILLGQLASTLLSSSNKDREW